MVEYDHQHKRLDMLLIAYARRQPYTEANARRQNSEHTVFSLSRNEAQDRVPRCMIVVTCLSMHV